MRLISKIFQKELDKGLPKISFDNDSTCEFCQRGKQTKSFFHSKNVVSTTRSFELLHLDLFGSTRTANLGGKKYGLVIVDDFSRFTWVIFLIHKDDACEAFQTFSKRVQNEKGFFITPSNQTMVENLKITLLKTFVLKMAFLMISLLLELLNKMGLWKGRIDLYKKWPK